MDRQERAELVVRAVGLAVLIDTAGWLALKGVWIFWSLRTFAQVSGGMPSPFVSIIAARGATALVGAVLMAWPTLVARLLVPRRPESEDTGLGELLRLGMFALAVQFLLGGLSAAAAALSPLPGLPVATATSLLLAAVFMARPRPLTGWLAGRTRAREGWSLAGALGMGLALIALYRIAGRLEGLAIVPDMLALRSRVPSLAAGQTHVLLTQDLVRVGIGLACWGLLLALCGPLGRWLARGAPESGRPVRTALGRGNWFELTFQTSVLLVLLTALLPSGSSTGTPSSPPVAKALAVVAVVVVVAVGLLVAAARLGAAVARALYPVLSDRYDLEPEDAAYMRQRDEPSDRHSLTIAVEVAITIAAIHSLLIHRSYRGAEFYEVLAQFILIGLLLVLRGDIARWCVRPLRGEQDARPRRQAALYPWLALLGVLLVLGAARPLIHRGLIQAGLVPESVGHPGQGRVAPAGWPPLWVSPAVGLLLVFARRPLARLLAYGPVLHGRGVIRHGLKSD